MTLTVTHSYVSAIPDSGDTTLVQPSNWNANHGLTGVLDVANGGTGISSFGTGVATFLGTPTSTNLAAALTDETGTGAAVFANSPQLNSPLLVTPGLGTPTQGILTNCTGLLATGGGTGQSTYAKGDILASPGSNTLNKLAVSITDGDVLTVDAASTNGIKWAAASAGGTPAGSGTEIQYRNAGAFGAMAGTAWDNTNRSLTMTGATVTTSNPVLNMTQTWNAGGTVFTGINLVITKTAAAVGSTYLKVGAGSNTRVALGPDVNFGIGAVAAALFGTSSAIGAGSTDLRFVTGSTGNSFLFLAGDPFASGAYTTMAVINNGQLQLVSDLFLTRTAAATLQFGAADAATAVAQTTQVQSVVAGTSGVAGALWTFQGSRSTGTAAGGDIAFFLSPNPGIAAATTQNTAVEHIRLQASGRIKFTNAAHFSANGSVATVLGSLGPTGSHTAVQKWLTIVDNGAVVGYIPVF